MRDINKKYTTNWMGIGLELEIDYDELVVIEKNHHSSLRANFLANHLQNQT